MELTPKQVVRELDRYIIGQDEAKRAVAVALRNRYRRAQLPEEIRDEIVPKNILMIGPTGVGKTEIARRLARLVDAPFVKVEATKFTEVGYVGRDVESIIRDLVEASVRICKEKASQKVKARATVLAEERDHRPRFCTRTASRSTPLTYCWATSPSSRSCPPRKSSASPRRPTNCAPS